MSLPQISSNCTNLELVNSSCSVNINLNGAITSINTSLELIAIIIKNISKIFYIVDPRETYYENVNDVPNFFYNAWPYFILFMIIENIILFTENKPTVRLNDSITSLSHGLFQQCGRLLFRGSESYFYIYIYQNWRVFELSWNSSSTWYLTALGVDFCYYWVHRACHEIHILWAQHQVHHSSEDYNLAVGLRQSALQSWTAFAFYLPLAFFIPPSQFVTHQYFNLLYQFWIHTEIVKNLGPLEWIFNTPNHHRVHHGSNIYCLDKNYGGVLIIWDRIFGTFAEEKKDEEIIYGLVYNRPSFNPFHLQIFYTKYVIQKFRTMNNWKYKFNAIFYGPSWEPGKPRLGLDEDKIHVTKREKFNVKISLWCNIYSIINPILDWDDITSITLPSLLDGRATRKSTMGLIILYLLIHFIVMVYGFHQLALRHLNLNPITVLIFVVYIIASLTNIGLLFENYQNSALFEVLRCMILVTTVQRIQFPDIDHYMLFFLELFYLLSGIFWFFNYIRIVDFITFKCNNKHDHV